MKTFKMIYIVKTREISLFYHLGKYNQNLYKVYIKNNGKRIAILSTYLFIETTSDYSSITNIQISTLFFW